MIVREQLAAALGRALEDLRGSGAVETTEVPAIQLDVPPAPELGDFSSDVAVALARQARKSPADVAALLVGRLDAPAGLIDRVDVSGSGFLNFHLGPKWLHDAVRQARARGADFGKSEEVGEGQSVLVEFVSAYPTGPLSVTHGRGGALGDALANALEWNGYRVVREFYVNDAGSQMERFGKSLEACYLQTLGRPGVAPPVDGYHGQYIVDLAKSIRDKVGDEYAELPAEERLRVLTERGRAAVLEQQRATLARFGVRFDEWRSEKALHESGKLQEVLERLRESGHTYETDGALWLRSTSLGDTEDRPLRRGNGQPTYLSGDLTYHQEKFARGFDCVVNIWGADHEDYIGRTRAGLQALGRDPGALEVLLFQPVAVKIDEMSIEGAALTGNNLGLDEVIEEVGADSARFFYLTRSPGSPLTLDLDLARSASAENPAQYVRLVRDRTAEAVRAAAGSLPAAEVDLAPLVHPSERALMRKLAELPDEIRATVRDRDPSRLTRYTHALASALDVFYLDAPLAGGGAETDAARLALLQAGEGALSNALRVMGIGAAGPSGS